MKFRGKPRCGPGETGVHFTHKRFLSPANGKTETRQLTFPRIVDTRNAWESVCVRVCVLDKERQSCSGIGISLLPEPNTTSLRKS